VSNPPENVTKFRRLSGKKFIKNNFKTPFNTVHLLTQINLFPTVPEIPIQGGKKQKKK